MKRIALVVVLGAGFAWTALSQTIEWVQVVSKPVSRKIDVPGEIQPFLSVALGARVSAAVEQVRVDRGSVVEQGDLLVELSAPDLVARIAEAEAKVQTVEADRLQAEAKLRSLEAATVALQASLASSQATLDRLKTAAQTPGAISGNELEISQRGVEAARANVDAQRASADAQRASIEALRSQKSAAEAAVRTLKEMSGYLRVTAPFAGIVTERLVHPGAIAGPGSGALVVLQQVDRLRLVVAVPEANAGGIVRGAVVEFQVPAFPERKFSGTIARVSQSLDQKTRTMPVELDVTNRNGALAPGMFASVAWPVRSTQPALYVPKTSVATTTERTFVIRDNHGRAEWVDVRKGAADGELIQVIGPLEAGNRVVKRATDEIRDGSVLR
jgi:multidrug efflux pump subunit AcrA (membrane-fusion protein)